MRTKLKWMMAGVLCATGVLLILLSFMFVHFDVTKFGKNGKSVRIEKTYKVEDVDQIISEDTSGDIRVEASLDDKIHLIYYENKNLKIGYTVTRDEKKLSIKRKSRFMIWQLNPFTFIDEDKYDVVIKVPSKKRFSYILKSVSGEVTMEDINAAVFEAESTSNTVKVKNMTTESVDIKTVSGKIITQFVKTGKAVFKTTSGLIESKKVEANSLHYHTVSGEIKTSATKTKSLYAETVSGKITFNDLYVHNMNVSSISGKIEGNLLLPEKEYSIDVETVSGKSNIEHTVRDTDKKIITKTTSGKIDITFVSP